MKPCLVCGLLSPEFHASHPQLCAGPVPDWREAGERRRAIESIEPFERRAHRISIAVVDFITRRRAEIRNERAA